MNVAHYSPDTSTVLDHARRIASRYGLAPTNHELDSILWNRTAFPYCDAEHLTGQLEDYFARIRSRR